MHQLLTLGQDVFTVTNQRPCRIERFIGGGGQGEVYAARLDGDPVAVKWYFARASTATQEAVLEDLIRRGPPSDRFLWPREIVQSPDVPGFGYVMRLREDRYHGLMELLKATIAPRYRALTRTAFELVDGFHRLHASGLCYRDISLGNVFFDPESGRVLICDNDNIVVNKKPLNSVVGTPRFMAPEIVRGEAAPSIETDLHSLAVLLFYIFVVHHPLEGKKETEIHCFDLKAMDKIYGGSHPFIFHPTDKSNAPDPSVHRNPLSLWGNYPAFFKQLFVTAFTDGLNNPGKRVRETEWRDALARLRDSIMLCPHCGEEVFYDIEKVRRAGRLLATCTECGRSFPLPPRMRLEHPNASHVIMLTEGTELYRHHLVRGERHPAFENPVATVKRKPRTQSLHDLQLENLSPTKWTITTPEGNMKDVPPGAAITVTNEMRLTFEGVTGQIRC